MRLKVMQKHSIKVQKKFKPRGTNCKYSRPVTANSEAAMKKGAWMRLKHDVWSGEISFSRTQQAEKRIGWRDERGWRIRGWRMQEKGESRVKEGYPPTLPTNDIHILILEHIIYVQWQSEMIGIISSALNFKNITEHNLRFCIFAQNQHSVW